MIPTVVKAWYRMSLYSTGGTHLRYAPRIAWPYSSNGLLASRTRVPKFQIAIAREGLGFKRGQKRRVDRYKEASTSV